MDAQFADARRYRIRAALARSAIVAIGFLLLVVEIALILAVLEFGGLAALSAIVVQLPALWQVIKTSGEIIKLAFSDAFSEPATSPFNQQQPRVLPTSTAADPTNPFFPPFKTPWPEAQPAQKPKAEPTTMSAGAFQDWPAPPSVTTEALGEGRQSRSTSGSNKEPKVRLITKIVDFVQSNSGTAAFVFITIASLTYLIWVIIDFIQRGISALKDAKELIAAIAGIVTSITALYTSTTLLRAKFGATKHGLVSVSSQPQSNPAKTPTPRKTRRKQRPHPNGQ